MDFRTWLRNQGFGDKLAWTGNDGGINRADYLSKNYGNSTDLGKSRTSNPADMAAGEATVVRGLYGRYQGEVSNSPENNDPATP